MIVDGEWEKDVESSPLREEPDFDAIAMEEHFAEFHPGGGPCDCPPPEPGEHDSAWDEWMSQHQADAHDGKACNCPEYTQPPF